MENVTTDPVNPVGRNTLSGIICYRLLRRKDKFPNLCPVRDDNHGDEEQADPQNRVGCSAHQIKPVRLTELFAL
jgi:hypothetical protein